MEFDDMNVRRGGTEIGAAPSSGSGERSIDQCMNRLRANIPPRAGSLAPTRVVVVRRFLRIGRSKGWDGRPPNGSHNVPATEAAHNGRLSMAFRLPRRV